MMFVVNSCKEPAKPKAVITVVRIDENDYQWPVSGAIVKLILPDGASLPQLTEYATDPQITDINGQVEYSFDYEGILQFQAEQGSGAESCGQGYVILREDEVYYETIRLSACYE